METTLNSVQPCRISFSFTDIYGVVMKVIKIMGVVKINETPKITPKLPNLIQNIHRMYEVRFFAKNKSPRLQKEKVKLKYS